MPTARTGDIATYYEEAGAGEPLTLICGLSADLQMWRFQAPELSNEKRGSNPMDLFERLRREDGWHHSGWNRRDIVQHSAAKVHMAVNYTRYRADGSVIGDCDSLYILALKDGRWGVQLRSSFGP